MFEKFLKTCIVSFDQTFKNSNNSRETVVGPYLNPNDGVASFVDGANKALFFSFLNIIALFNGYQLLNAKSTTPTGKNYNTIMN